MIRIFLTVLAALLGLAFGSFLNVCLSRWPEGESVVKPRSHCRNCGRTLTWWENIPLASWLALRGRCRTCGAKISWRYPLVELLIGMGWAYVAWRFAFGLQYLNSPHAALPVLIVCFLGPFALLWLLVGLATLDAEHLWLPNTLTLPALFGGLLVAALQRYFFEGTVITPITPTDFFLSHYMREFWLGRFLSVFLAAALILLIRWTYWLIRRREGIGLGDAKLMAMLGAWLGLSGALLSFAIGVFLGAIFALIALALPSARRESSTWLGAKLPLGTFLCIGGMVSALWGHSIIAAYLRWAGF